MALKEIMLDGTVVDKVQIAINRFKAFEPPEGYFLAFSGGKEVIQHKLTSRSLLMLQIELLNLYRNAYLETKDKQYWWQMIQLLPCSYNQRRTVQLNYAVLKNMYHARKNHKLDEWHDFCHWIEELPYSELITGEKENECK